MLLLDSVKALDLLYVVQDLGFKVLNDRRMFCPFHQDDTPSLIFYPEQNRFHCFGCGKRGDIINFYAEYYQVDFKTALQQLAVRYLKEQKANYQANKFTVNRTENVVPKAKIEEKIFKPVFSEIYENFREYCLNQAPNQVAKDAANYLRGRGFTDKTMREFNIFVIKDYGQVNLHLKKLYPLQVLQEAGLYNEKGNLVFFMHAIIIPFYENQQIIYLQGRSIGNPTEKSHAKYQFLKGIARPMFNTDILKKLKTNQNIYLTEGAFDCMTLVQNGLAAVSFGSAGTFKKEWSKQFQRFQVIVYFDNDKAGYEGGLNVLEELTLAGISVERKYLPVGYKDVNEYYTKLSD